MGTDLYECAVEQVERDFSEGRIDSNARKASILELNRDLIAAADAEDDARNAFYEGCDRPPPT